MPKNIIVAGFGPGISKAVAERFGKEGFSVALIGRNAERLAAGAKGLGALGIEARAFPGDLSQPDTARELVKKIRAAMGPISVLQWTAYVPAAGDLTKATTAELRQAIDVATTSLVAATQEALPDLRTEKGAVLVTNGGFALFDAKVDEMAVQYGAMGLAVANSAKHKLVRLLNAKLKGEGVYVGEVLVTGTVKGTVFDQGNANLDPADIAAKFWDVYRARSAVSTMV